MTSTVRTVPLSVLDLALVGAEQTSTTALRATTALAQHAEALGYSRFWVAEHHNMPAVASTSPPVLIAHLAASTFHIRVGSGGVMLPNHTPFVVAEQFAMLEALHPGRIDLGLGRAPGTDPGTAAALRRSPDALTVEQFPQHVIDLIALLDASDGDDKQRGRLVATPNAVSSPSVVLLGSSGYSAQLAAALGLPFAFAHHFAGTHTLPAVALYRKQFRPSQFLDRPHVIITASTIVADTEDEARWHARPSQLLMWSLRTGRLRPLHSPQEAAEHPHRDEAERLPSTQLVGTADAIATDLRRLTGDTGADELMITSPTYGVDERKRSIELLADEWDLAARAA
jgi:luciferase family oxidoreductase group 1